jgi:pimeloyl-ACP methyl ester carboxylesterase
MSKWLKIVLIIVLVIAVIVLIGPFLVPVPELEGLQSAQALASENSQFTTIPFPGTDGIDIHYIEGGNGGTSFVLLHGFSSNVYTWDNVFDFFAENGATTAYDRPPFGLSERLLRSDWDPAGDNPYTTAAAVEQLMAFMTDQGIDDAVLVGNSAGGLIALQAAQTYPDRVQGLILADPAIYTTGAPAFLSSIADTPQLRRLGPLVARVFATNESLLDLAYHDPSAVSAETLQNAAIGTQVEDWDEAFWQFTAAATNADNVVEQIPMTTIPTLVITGDDDRIVPTEDSVRLASELPNAELAIMEACGHVPQDECPDQFIEAVDTWLAQQSFGMGR